MLDSNQGQKRRVSKIFMHPQYHENRDFAYNAAVLSLSSPVSGIAPIKLATSKQNFLEPGAQRDGLSAGATP